MRGFNVRLGLVLAAAAAVRVLVLLHTPGYRPFGDPADYLRYAVSIRYLHRFPATAYAAFGTPTALRPPGYPLLLAGVLRIAGLHLTAMRLVNVGLGVVSVWLIYLIARQVLGARVAWWSALVAAWFPPMVWLSAALLSENLFVPLMLGAVYALLRWHARPDVKWAFAVGALIGAATMTRGNGIWLLLPTLASIAVAARKTPEALTRSVVAVCAAFAVVLMPWTVRNADAFGRFLPLGTQTGYTLAGEYNSAARKADSFQADWRVPQTTPDYGPLLAHPTLDEGALDGALRDRALRFAGRHPGYVARAAELNLLRLFDVGLGHNFVGNLSYREMGVPADSITVLRVGLYAVLALAALGLVALITRPELLGLPGRAPAWFWSVPVVMFLSVVFVLGSPRYRAPVDRICRCSPDSALRRWFRRPGASGELHVHDHDIAAQPVANGQTPAPVVFAAGYAAYVRPPPLGAPSAPERMGHCRRAC